MLYLLKGNTWRIDLLQFTLFFLLIFYFMHNFRSRLCNRRLDWFLDLLLDWFFHRLFCLRLNWLFLFINLNNFSIFLFFRGLNLFLNLLWLILLWLRSFWSRLGLISWRFIENLVQRVFLLLNRFLRNFLYFNSFGYFFCIFIFLSFV